MRSSLALIFALLACLSTAWSADTVAIMDFKVNKLNADAGGEIADLMSALLSEVDGVDIVERKKLKALLGEQELGQLGFSEEKTAAKVQKLFGAKFYVMGKLFPVGKKLYLTFSLISTETGMKKTKVVKAPMSDDYATLAEQAAEGLIALHAESAQNMKPKAEVTAYDELKKKVGDLSKLRFAIHIPEKHLRSRIPDPAAQTELIRPLQKLGAKVSLYKETIESELIKGGKKEITIPLDNIDILIKGEAFSTFGARRGSLVSCKARIELKATAAHTGKLLAMDHTSVAGVDVSEPIAAKKALRMSADKVARRFVPEIVKAWRAQGAR